jgi:hypothetical protein
MEATDIEANPEGIGAAAKRQELLKKEIYFDNIGSLEERYGDRCLVVWRHRWGGKWTQEIVGVPTEVVHRPETVDRPHFLSTTKGNCS